MATMRKIAPLVVKRRLIHHGRWSIDAQYGLVEYDRGSDDPSVVEMILTDYDKVYTGEVFVPYDDSGCYPSPEPSLYMMKMKHSNWALTGDDLEPLEVDTNTYDKVWLVK